MKDDFAKAVRLLRFSVGRGVNTALFVWFFLLGLVMESVESFGVIKSFEFPPVDAGSIFLVCTALFPSQMLLSVGTSTMVQTSVCKKKLQTSMHTVFLSIGVTVMFTLILALRLSGLFAQGLSFDELNILPVGIFAAVIMIYSGFVYKFFVLSVIVLYGVMMGYGAVSGYWFAKGEGFVQFRPGIGSAAVNIALCYGLIAAAAGVEHLIARRLYRLPLSGYALRCSGNRR